MSIQITTLFTAIYTLVYLLMSFYAARTRRNQKVSVGEGNENLQRAVRMHGNYFEYTLFFLFTILILELNKTNELYLYVICSVFLLGRIFHAYSMVAKKGLFRVLGMMLTFASYLSNLVYLFKLV